MEVIETWLLTPFWEIIPPTKELRLTVGCGGWDFRNFTNFDPQKNKTGFLAIPKQTPKSANQLPAPTLKITIKVSCYLPLFSWKEGVRVMTPVHGYRGSEKQGCKYPQRRFFINQPEKLLLGWNTFLQEFCRGYWNQSTLEPVFSWNTFPLRGSVEVIETWLLTPFWEIIPIIPTVWQSDWIGDLYSIHRSCKLDWHIWQFGAQTLGVQMTWCPNTLVPNWLGVPEYRCTGLPVYWCTGILV